MKYLTVLGALLIPSIATAQSQHGHVYVPIDSSYKLIFDEEFNGTALDQTKWAPNWFGQTAGSITRPVNAYPVETAADDPAQVSVSGGSLTLATVAKWVSLNRTTYPYRTGLISSNGKFQFTFGYAEARIYFPGVGTQIANWPSFWLDGQNWPADGEIDIVEGLSRTAQWHFHSSRGAQGGDAGSGYAGGWHVFGVLWTSSAITYYYDGVQVGKITSGVTSSPMYVVLANAIGQYGGPLLVPDNMTVDYVHVYSQTDPAVTPQPNYNGPGDSGPLSSQCQ